MTVIVTACSAFGLTLSDEETEIICLQTTGCGRISLASDAAG